MSLSRRMTAELFGTFWLVFGGCGAAVISAAFPQLGIGILGVALAFGLTFLTMAYAIGHVSGCHLNPAVTLGLVLRAPRPASRRSPSASPCPSSTSWAFRSRTPASTRRARPTTALIAGGWAVGQLWLLRIAPLVGGALAGLAYPVLFGIERGRMGARRAQRAPDAGVTPFVRAGGIEKPLVERGAPHPAAPIGAAPSSA